MSVNVAAPDPTPRPQPPDGSWRTAAAPDGTAIAWRGDGPRTSARTPVVLCNGIACSTAYWADVAPRLATDRRLIQWDYRGHGRSASPERLDAVTVPDVVDDLVAVMAAAGVARAVLVGHSYGVQVVLEAARRVPHLVAAVVAIAGAPGHPLPASVARAGLGPFDLIERAWTLAPARAEAAWRALWRGPVISLAARMVGGTSAAAPRDVMTEYYDHVAERDVGLLMAMMRAMQEHDASDVAGSLTVPLLALAGDADRVTPLPVMSRLALAAPDGELAVCHGGTHTLPAEQPQWVTGHLQPLLGRVDGRWRSAPAATGS